MLSSAWNAITGKRSRDDEKKAEAEAEEHKSHDMQVMPSRMSSSAPGGPPIAAPLNSHDGPASRTRKRSKNEQQLRNPPTTTVPVAPAASAVPSYMAPPMHAPTSAAQEAHPEHPPPSYESHQYPIASAAPEPVVFFDGHPEKHEQQAEEIKEGEHKQQPPPPQQQQQQQQQNLAHPASLQVPVAVPPMVDEPMSLSHRLAGAAAGAFFALQANPTYQRGQAKALALAGKHISPEVLDFLQAPSLGKLLRHPSMILIVYKLYSKVKAPFIGLFRTLLVNAAKRALWKRKHMSEAEMKVNADATNAAINHGLEQAIGKNMNVNLSPEVCKHIVDNIDMNQLKEMFAWFETTPVDQSGAAAAAKGKNKKK